MLPPDGEAVKTQSDNVSNGICFLFFFSCVACARPAGVACFLQSGRYDWIPDWACCSSSVDPLPPQAAHVQVQVMD